MKKHFFLPASLKMRLEKRGKQGCRLNFDWIQSARSLKEIARIDTSGQEAKYTFPENEQHTYSVIKHILLECYQKLAYVHDCLLRWQLMPWHQYEWHSYYEHPGNQIKCQALAYGGLSPYIRKAH